MISAYAGKEEEARCAELGVNVFLRKPITASSLFDAIVSRRACACMPRGAASMRRSSVSSTGVRALLAEDNEANQMVATELLGRLGIELDIARNGREAIAMAQAAPTKYDAILMDMQMPELDGLAATRALRADPRFTRIPIIAMTANAMKVDLDACLAAGMNDHVTKPIDRRALLATLRRWLPSSPKRLRASRARPSDGAVRRRCSPASTSTAHSNDSESTAPRSSECWSAFPPACATSSRHCGRRSRPATERWRRRTPTRSPAHAGNLGAEALRAAAKALEQAGRDGRTDLGELLDSRRAKRGRGLGVDRHACARPLTARSTVRDSPSTARSLGRRSTG